MGNFLLLTVITLGLVIGSLILIINFWCAEHFIIVLLSYVQV